jgi:dolichol-phosphate mannosyltransferase
MLSFAMDGMLSFSKLPLRAAAALGLLAIAVGMLVTAGVLVGAVTGRRFEFGWAAVLASVHVLGGCILLALGVVGEYVGRIYEQVKARPLYVLKDRSPDRQIARSGMGAAPPVRKSA